MKRLVATVLLLLGFVGCAPDNVGDATSPPDSAELSDVVETAAPPAAIPSAPTPTSTPPPTSTPKPPPAPTLDFAEKFDRPSKHNIEYSFNINLPNSVDGWHGVDELVTQYYGEAKYELITSNSYGPIYPYYGGSVVYDEIYGVEYSFGAPLYGFVDGESRVLCEPVYNTVELTTVDGHKFYRATRGGQKEVAIASDGSWVLAFDEYKTHNSHEGSGVLDPLRVYPAYTYPTVRIGDKWGIFDGTGVLRVEPISDWHIAYSEGLASVMNFEKREFWYIDTSGKTVLGPYLLPTATQLPPSINKQYYVQHYGIGEWGFTTHDLNLFFSEGLSKYFDGELTGFIDINGEIVIPAQYWYATPFLDGLSRVIIDMDDTVSRAVTKTGRMSDAEFPVNITGYYTDIRGVPYHFTYGGNAYIQTFGDKHVGYIISPDGEILRDDVPRETYTQEAGYGWTYVYNYSVTNEFYLIKGEKRIDFEEHVYPIALSEDLFIIGYYSTNRGWQIIDSDDNPVSERRKGTANKLGDGILWTVDTGDIATSHWYICDIGGNILEEHSGSYYSMKVNNMPITVEGLVNYQEQGKMHFVTTKDYSGIIDADGNWLMKRRLVNTDD